MRRSVRLLIGCVAMSAALGHGLAGHGLFGDGLFDIRHGFARKLLAYFSESVISHSVSLLSFIGLMAIYKITKSFESQPPESCDQP